MGSPSENTAHQIRSINVDGHAYLVSLHVGFDGIEYIGRLWFTDASDVGIAFQDHGAVPGGTVVEAVGKAKEFLLAELEHRCYRALSEKRRFGRLRSATDEMINQIKYLNRVVISLQNGTIERDAGQREIDEIQGKILEVVRSFPIHAGVEAD